MSGEGGYEADDVGSIAINLDPAGLRNCAAPRRSGGIASHLRSCSDSIACQGSRGAQGNLQPGSTAVAAAAGTASCPATASLSPPSNIQGSPRSPVASTSPRRVQAQQTPQRPEMKADPAQASATPANSSTGTVKYNPPPRTVDFSRSVPNAVNRHVSSPAAPPGKPPAPWLKTHQIAALQTPTSLRRCRSAPAVLHLPANMVTRKKRLARRRASTHIPRSILRTGLPNKRPTHKVAFGFRYSFDDMSASEENVGKRVSAFEEEKLVRKRQEWLEERRMCLGDDEEYLVDSDDSALTEDSHGNGRARIRSEALDDDEVEGGRRSRARSDWDFQSVDDEQPHQGRTRTRSDFVFDEENDDSGPRYSARDRVGTYFTAASSDPPGTDSMDSNDPTLTGGGRRARTRSDFFNVEDIGVIEESSADPQGGPQGRDRSQILAGSDFDDGFPQLHAASSGDGESKPRVSFEVPA